MIEEGGCKKGVGQNSSGSGRGVEKGSQFFIAPNVYFLFWELVNALGNRAFSGKPPLKNLC